MSNDSIDQYAQAVSEEYHNWHPPAMSIVVSLFMKCGGGIGLLMFVQCVCGCFGVYSLAMNVLSNAQASRPATQCLASGILFALLLPWSPLAFYLMTFWKDSWVAIAFLFICSISLRIYQRASSTSAPRFFTSCVMLTAVMAIAMVTRYNAMVVLPSFCFVLWILLRQRVSHRILACSLTLFPLILMGTLSSCQNAFFDVEDRHPERQVMTLDLVGMIVQDPALRNELPYTSQHVTEYYQTRYTFGDVGPLLYQQPLIVDGTYGDGVRNERLTREYQQAIMRFPLTWMKVKVQAFYEMVHPTITHYWFQTGIVPNTVGLAANPRYEKMRNALISTAQRVKESPLLRLFSGVHLVWIVANILGILFSVILYLRWRQLHFLFWAALLSIPLSYYASYLFAATARDFRFMYPATLTLQVMALSIAISVILNRLHKERGVRV